MSTANAELSRAEAVRRRGGIVRYLSRSLDALGNRLGHRRSRRIVLLLAMLWLCGVFDLVFTLTAHRIGNFAEFNPLAAALLSHTVALIAFKLAMLAVGSAILFAVRHRLIAEIACWALCAVYVVLSAIWLHYYTFLPSSVR